MVKQPHGLKRISAPQAHSLQGNQENHWRSLVPSSRWKGIPRHAIRISASLARSVCHPTNQDGRRPSDTLDMCGISLLAHPCLARSRSEKAGRRAMPSYRFHGLGCHGVTVLTHANSDPIVACAGRIVVPDRLLHAPTVTAPACWCSGGALIEDSVNRVCKSGTQGATLSTDHPQK